MSDETAQALKAALLRQEEADEVLRQEKERSLASIAEGLDAHINEIAKRVAYDHPEVTREIGKDGVRELRAELAAAAQTLAIDLNSAVDQIKWPRQTQRSNFTTTTARDEQTALFKYLYGSRTNAIAQIFKAHGFPIQDDNAQRSQGLVLPQYLFDGDALAAVAEAQAVADQARWGVDDAKAADDRAAVDDIWGD